MNRQSSTRAKTHLKSLREFLDALEGIGEVQPIDKEVDWNLEMGAIARRSMDLRLPAPLFNRIKGISSTSFVDPDSPRSLDH
jgi:UbiD family decarboxylase